MLSIYNLFEIKILESTPLSMKQLTSFESKYNLNLPEEYRNFLIKYNGGYPDLNIFTVIMHNQKNDGVINRFLRVNNNKIDGVYHYIKIYKNRIPKNTIPIAYDVFGNLILICTLGKNQGSIYFWDHENETEPPSYDNVHLISPSFDNFINSLRKQ